MKIEGQRNSSKTDRTTQIEILLKLYNIIDIKRQIVYNTVITQDRARCRDLKSVVLIDDDLDFNAKLSRLVKSHAEFNVVISTHSGREGILAIEYYRPNLVILDIIMPDNDGISVLKYIRGKDRSYNPFIYVITAMNTPVVQTILDGLEVDFVNYKPVDNDVVKSKLEQIINAEPKQLNQNISFALKNAVDFIIDVMNEFEIPTHLIGSEYIKTVLIFMLDDPTLKRNVYAKVATVFNSTSRTVAANINNAIIACMGSKMYRAEFGNMKAETLLFLNKLSIIVKKRMQGSDIS